MSSFSPFSTILNQNNLTSPNYVNWKRNLDIVFTTEGHKYVLTEACLDNIESNESEEENNELIAGRNLMRWQNIRSWPLCQI